MVCGTLLKDDGEHAEVLVGGCSACGGNVRLVGQGEQIVQFAQWFRCLDCKGLYMFRRGDLVPTKPRNGFEEFTQF